jgi:hypothetical protein
MTSTEAGEILYQQVPSWTQESQFFENQSVKNPPIMMPRLLMSFLTSSSMNSGRSISVRRVILYL